MQLPATPVRVVAAPMAGGISTPQLVAAVCEAGGMGFLAAGYRTAAQLADEIAEVRRQTRHPFGVNVFVPAPPPQPASQAANEAAVERYSARLRPLADRLGVHLPEPDWSDTDHWDDKLTLLTADPVPVVSFTFGCPPADVVARLQQAGSSVVVTVTDLPEAQAAAAVGADALVVQGFEAGGHRGTHRVEDVPSPYDHLALLPMIAEVGLPMIAAGGISTAGDTVRALAAGAVAVQVGTALLLCPEAGTSAAYRMGLTDPSLASVITRAFTGRPARGLANRFVVDHDGHAPACYPVIDQLTKPLRAAAARRGDLGGLSLWAGSGWRAATEEPAALVVRRLAGLS